jgi:hypothetical protein
MGFLDFLEHAPRWQVWRLILTALAIFWLVIVPAAVAIPLLVG